MAVKTDIMQIDEDNWVNIATGESHVALCIQYPSKMRVILSSDGTFPTPGNPEFLSISSGTDDFTGFRLSTSFDNLEAGDDIFVRNESGFDKILVVHGNVEIRGR